jgi:hypothetical protein
VYVLKYYPSVSIISVSFFVVARCVRSPTPASKQPPDSKAVWIFTNQDDPCHGNEDQRKRMYTLKRDYQEAGVAIHVLPLPKRQSSESEGDRSFDWKIFYNDLMTAPNDGENYTSDLSADDDDGKLPASAVVDIDTILDRFASGTKRRRKYATLPLLLPGWMGRRGDDGGENDAGESPGIMLDLYGVVQVRNKPQKVSVHQENNK